MSGLRFSGEYITPCRGAIGGQLKRRVFPCTLPSQRRILGGKDTGWKARNHNHGPNGAIMPGEGADPARGRAGYRERNVVAILEQLCLAPPKVQGLISQKQLDPAVLPVSQKIQQ